jgi:hypothetical protein
MQVASRCFRAGLFTSWDALFTEVAAFASQIGRNDLITISHSEDKGSAVVTRLVLGALSTAFAARALLGYPAHV